MAKKNGTLIVMRQGATHGLTQTTIVGQTDATMNTTADMLDSTTKDNAAKAKSFAPGETGWTFSISGLYDPAATTEGSVSNAITYLKAGTAWVASWGEDVTDENYWYGTIYLSSVNVTGPKNDLASYTLEAQGTGILTEDSN